LPKKEAKSKSKYGINLNPIILNIGKQMYAKAIVTAMIVLFVAIGMTGIGAAMDTNVYYNNDGSYDCNYDATGTGSIGIHTFTSDGEDHLVSGWTNSVASGWQAMETQSGNAFSGAYSYTTIDRSATVGGARVGGDEAGYILTLTTDNNDNSVYTYADYHDNRGWGSHVTTDQTVVVGSLVNIGGNNWNVTGVAAVTEISGFAYGSNTTVSGLVRTQTGDEYTYAYIQMDNGKMNLYTLSAAASVDPALFGTYNGATGQLVYVNAEGVGTFGAGAGTDMHGAAFHMVDDIGTQNYYSNGAGVTMDMATTFDGNFNANGYVYAVNLTATP